LKVELFQNGLILDFSIRLVALGGNLDIDFSEEPRQEFRPSLLRWSIGTFLILISWLIIGAVFTGLTAARFGIDINALAGDDPGLLASYEPWQAATTILVSFLPLLLTPILLHRFLLKGDYRSLFTRSNKGFGGEVRNGALAMVVILLATSVPDILVNSNSYKWTFDLQRFIPYLLVAITLIPLQTTAEEVFYRGWIQQRLENGRRSIWFISSVNGLLFALPHLANPEVNGELLFALLGYGASGFMFAWVTMRDKSIGIAVGAHAANNIMAGLFITSVDSALPAASLWTTPAVSWLPAAIISILMIPLFIWLTGKLNAKQFLS
jgi:membrane protease YdiL (CAAX protease family)